MKINNFYLNPQIYIIVYIEAQENMEISMSSFEFYKAQATSSYHVAPKLVDHFAILLGITVKDHLLVFI